MSMIRSKVSFSHTGVSVKNRNYCIGLRINQNKDIATTLQKCQRYSVFSQILQFFSADAERAEAVTHVNINVGLIHHQPDNGGRNTPLLRAANCMPGNFIFLPSNHF